MFDRSSNRPLLIAALSLVLLTGFTAAPAAFAGDGEVHKQEVREMRIEVDCDGENCDQAGARKFVIKGHGGDNEELHERLTTLAGMHQGSGTYLGVALTELTPELREHFGVAAETGVMVSKVIEGSPAERAGVKVGDIITALNGQGVKSASGLSHAVRQNEAGDEVSIEVVRRDGMANLTATLEERKAMKWEGMEHALHQNHVEVELDCEGDDCGNGRQLGAFLAQDLCEGLEECEVRVECSAPGDCTCTVNGEEAECQAVHLGGPGHAMKWKQKSDN